MDYITFEKAMERAKKALFLDCDTERCMKILHTIIVKFESVRKCGPKCLSVPGAECPTIAQRVACFSGNFCPGAAISVHVSMARFWAGKGEVKPLFTTLGQLLVVSYFWRLQKVSLSLPFTPPSSPQADCSIASHHNPYQVGLPAEIWREVANWLTRPDWRMLLRVPHPLRKFASDLFFRDIFLQFDVYSSCSDDVQLSRRQEELQAWHSQRTLGIMTRILRDWRFAGRVRSLRVHMCDHRLGGPIDVINFELNCFAEVLWKLSGLKTLYLYGSPIFLYNLVSRLPDLTPRVEGVTIRYHQYEGRIYCPRIPAPLRNLEQLCVHPTTADLCAYNDGLKEASQTLRRLKMAHHSSPVPIITPLAGNLTHLELVAPWGGASETSLFHVILGSGERLESLRLVGYPLQAHSIHFRQFRRSLPLLRDFGIRLVHGRMAMIDPDLFPAICDFLRDRPLLESLELVAYTREVDQAAFGFGTYVWEFVSSLPRLRILSANLLSAIPRKRMIGLIPRSIKTLSVPPCGVWYLEQLLQEDGWPDDLRFFGIDESPQQNAISLARKIAISIPSVRVVRLSQDYFTVTGRNDGKSVRVDQWPSRAAEIYRKEYLDSCGCEDYEYLYVDHSYVLPR